MVEGNIGAVRFPMPDFGRVSAAEVVALPRPAFQAVG
ncbi:hypothetical protein SRABI05_01266 [Agrobacterium fabrum]|jgi:hypothetical protein|uniref:Uncharacterized protein n=1 Tax=Agrobacterium fabrum TaxID=1176649 RepID=A0A7Z7BNJ8_9HYPH|nr:hypothetical protein [Agrobacterium fabrum]CAH0134232.1 hypothetical protein SRABI46_00368 [Agrobacterium fabrum]CAH0181229.1 hypothetical protein SRABI05_01266 [Agrobacterium fabrum]SDJ81019.1 hypothetical protein SAMN05428983_2919 [Agrobacterium fabrum]